MKLSRRIEGSICGTGFLRRPSLCWLTSARATNIFCAVVSTGARGWCLSASSCRATDHTPSHLSILPHCRPFCSTVRLGSGRTSVRFFTGSVPRAAGTHSPHLDDGYGSTAQEGEDAENTGFIASGPATDHVAAQPSKAELLSFVGSYAEDDTVEEHLEFIRDPYLRGYAPANGPELKIIDERYDPLPPPSSQVAEPSKEEKAILRELRHAVLSRRKSPERGPTDDEIYEIYCRLAEPRMATIRQNLRFNLLFVLSQGVKKNAKTMLRYFALLADVKACGIPLTRGQWNAAIHFASRHVSVVTDGEVESALSLWREMEHTANIKANEITFNILFDVASKAGNFTLAEMLYREMENRRIPFNRYHHVSLICFFGLMMDLDGVRTAYKEMVEAGEVIDHVVLNCVISSLLRCGDEDGALRVYERMKASDAATAALSLPPRSYATQKAVTKVLMMFARVGKTFPDLRAGFQVAAPLAPDLQTYRILIKHFSVRMGRIEQVARCLDEMKALQIPLHGAIFLSLFKGFAMHGSRTGSDWSPQRLFGVWEALLQALDRESPGLRVETWLVCWALRAFEKCGQREMIMDVYDELSGRWDLDPERAEFMIRYLHSTMKRLGLEV